MSFSSWGLGVSSEGTGTSGVGMVGGFDLQFPIKFCQLIMVVEMQSKLTNVMDFNGGNCKLRPHNSMYSA